MVLNGFIFFLLLLIFRPWFGIVGTLSAGDWPYLFSEQIKEFSFLPEARFLWLAPYYQILTQVVVQNLGLSWHLVERLFWFWPWVAVSFYSSLRLTKSWLGALIYTTNTYALMVVGGGQMGVAMAYSLAPLVLHTYTKSSTKHNALLLTGLLLALEVMFDPRIALLTFTAAVLYWIIIFPKEVKSLLWWFGVPLIIVAVLHSYWWVPFLKNPNLLGIQFRGVSTEAVKYLSFGSFSAALGLLHPNWPENIFGKVYFLKPEFLVIPLLGFGSLLFVRSIKNRLHQRTILFFVLLVLAGAFLAKGSQEPFGSLYIWLFNYVPLFNLFRDSTKFYLWIALGYSCLIPMALAQFKRWRWVGFAFLLFWSFTLREALMGNLNGTFQPVEVPKEYVQLKDFLKFQPQYYKTSWYPAKSRFTFENTLHPAIEFSSVSANVRYVIVPVDVRGEIFVTDRMYDEVKHQEAIISIATMSGIRRLEEFKDLAVFEVLQ